MAASFSTGLPVVHTGRRSQRWRAEQLRNIAGSNVVVE